MSVLWTIMPTELVYAGTERPDRTFIEIARSGVTMVVSPANDGTAVIERLISPNPMDYLRAEWQPGMLIRLNE